MVAYWGKRNLEINRGEESYFQLFFRTLIFALSYKLIYPTLKVRYAIFVVMNIRWSTPLFQDYIDANLFPIPKSRIAI